MNTDEATTIHYSSGKTKVLFKGKVFDTLEAWQNFVEENQRSIPRRVVNDADLPFVFRIDVSDLKSFVEDDRELANELQRTIENYYQKVWNRWQRKSTQE